MITVVMEKRTRELYVLPRKSKATAAVTHVSFDMHDTSTKYQSVGSSLRPSLLKARRGSLRSADAAVIVAARHAKVCDS